MASRMVASVAGRSSSSPRLKSPPAALSVTRPASPPGLRLLAARAGDHHKIHRLLLSVFHGPSPAEFHAQIEEPGYEAADRLVVKDDDEIAAHLRLARQTIQLGSVTAPVVRFMDLATAPEYRSRGLASALLTAGERSARERGTLIALTRTRVPTLFAQLGWSVCGQHVFSTAAPRAVLAELSAEAERSAASEEAPATILFEPRQAQVAVRPLRRIELDAVGRLYAQNLAGKCGWPIRSEAYWEWLLARKSCDRVFVAASGGEPNSIAELLASIVGYAFVRQSRIVELVTAPGQGDVARQLAARVCADACEHTDGHLRCDVEPSHPLHNLLRRAGGHVTTCRELSGEVFMARLLDPLMALRQMLGELASRADAADLPLPSELGVELRAGGGSKGGAKPGVVERYLIQLGKRGASIATGGPSRHTVVLRTSDLAPLLLGHSGAAELEANGRLRCSTSTARTLAACLFPSGVWFRPALDDLLA